MKKSFVFALTAFSLLAIVSCGGGNSSPAPSTEEATSSSQGKEIESYEEKGSEHGKPYSITNNFGENADTELIVQWQNEVGSLDQRVQITTPDDPDFTYAHNVDATERTLDNASLMSKKLGNYASRGIYKSTIKDLLPDTDYIYRVGASGNWSETYYHTTAEGENTDFAFTVFSDPQSKISETHDAMVKTLTKSEEYEDDNRFFLCNGDVSDDQGNQPGEIQDYADMATTFNKYKPISITQGNHDTYGTTKSNYLWGESTVFNAYMTYPNNGWETNPEKSASYYYYYNNVLFIVMNTLIKDEDYDRQADWLIDVLEANKESGRGEYIIVNSHIGPIGNRYGDKWKESPIRNTYTPIFNKYKVDCVFYGHDHTYARTNPIVIDGTMDLKTVDTTPDTENGVIYSIVGATGPKFYGEDDKSYQTNIWEIRTTAKADVEPGVFVNVRVKDDELEVIAQKSDEEMTLLDSYTVPKKAR